MYYVYILCCSDNTLYCGKTTDLERRLSEHNESKKGAKYTRGRRPVKLVYAEKLRSLSKALRREFEVKRLSRQQKLQLISS